MKKVSFVIPCYRSEKTLESVVNEIISTMIKEQEYSYEIVLVNDCSPDNVWEVIRTLAQKDKNIIGINLAKNFGQYSALMAGYNHVTGDIVVSLDDDGQTPANEVMNLISKLEEGYDIVFASYKQNMESAFRRFGSWVNAKMSEYMVGKPKEIAVQSYYVAKRFIIDEIVKYEHAYPYISGLLFRTTKNVANVEVVHRNREQGTSGYTFSKLIGLWMNGFTAFSIKPLRIATFIGAFSSVFGFLLGFYFLIQKFINPETPLGYSSLITSVVFFSGLIMMMLGIIGEYIGRIYICINNSPQFVVKETTIEL